jgi:acyl-CoA reductase-like NAD-dependent aldehyde dehydrogenase
VSDYPLLINGRLEEGARRLNVLNPATEEVGATCARASEAQLDAAVDAAAVAFPLWAATSLADRRAALEAVADIAQANAEEIGKILTLEQGKPLREAIAEVHGFAFFTRHFAQAELAVDVLEETDTRRVEAHRIPLGVVGAIIPWNFPLILLGFKFGPALITGNTLVVKPAPTTPLATLKLAALVKDVLPPGVLNVIVDDNDLGPALSSHPKIRKISFTGSTATGARVMASAASTLKRITLEMGGNDAGIVLPDVDPKEVAPKLFASAFGNCGQICIAMKRLYVHDDIHDAVCDELAKIARSKTIGDGFDESTDLGPLQNRKQFERVKELIEDAAKHGTVIAGGTAPDRPGFFIEPTIVRDVAEGVRLVDEEQFGPALPVIRFSDADEAMDRINQAGEGLGGSIWTSDLARAGALAARFETGTVWVNKHGELDPSIPFSGAKTSGIGTELGREGVEEFTQQKIVNMAL